MLLTRAIGRTRVKETFAALEAAVEAERGATEQPKSGASEEQEWIPPGTRPALTRSGSW